MRQTLNQEFKELKGKIFQNIKDLEKAAAIIDVWQNTVQNIEVGEYNISGIKTPLLKMIDNGQDSGYQSNFGRVPYEETHFEEKDENNFVSKGFLITQRTRIAEKYNPSVVVSH